MTNFASYFLAGLTALLVSDFFNPIFGPGPAPLGAVDPAAAISTQVVDRTHKGDRLDRPSRAILMARDLTRTDVHLVRIQVFHRLQPTPLPVGYDAIASLLAETGST